MLAALSPRTALQGLNPRSGRPHFTGFWDYHTNTPSPAHTGRLTARFRTGRPSVVRGHLRVTPRIWTPELPDGIALASIFRVLMWLVESAAGCCFQRLVVASGPAVAPGGRGSASLLIEDGCSE